MFFFIPGIPSTSIEIEPEVLFKGKAACNLTKRIIIFIDYIHSYHVCDLNDRSIYQ
jgi:hypothetical protein